MGGRTSMYGQCMVNVPSFMNCTRLFVYGGQNSFRWTIPFVIEGKSKSLTHHIAFVIQIHWTKSRGSRKVKIHEG
ncbi:hypothetical protein J1N35_008945 [Gossypium stocksii]|uniref:Uncharacterized protein n=1 Tax=Gossypium stocksii TaxID=47602 RepID=A0A9D3W9T3_9ROSI|nr:hypothetical protein J1N35_008945 [Gossypium stocksii]